MTDRLQSPESALNVMGPKEPREIDIRNVSLDLDASNCSQSISTIEMLRSTNAAIDLSLTLKFP